MASVDSVGRITVRRNVDLSRYLGWTQGALVFNDTPLRDAVRDVERAYDVRVTIADSDLAVKLVTASFARQSIDEVLEEITHVVGAHYERTGRRVVIRRGTAEATHSHPEMRPVLHTTLAGAGL
jgi:ferric-dicitrate binding protein FerR (iron transport regulator)